MSVPSYVLNFDELSALLKDYLENGVSVDLSNTTFNTTLLENLLKDISSKVQGVDYTSLIAALNDLGAKLSNITGSLGLSGTQKIYGTMLEVYPNDTITFTVPRTGKITGITYSLSSWNYEDSINLSVGDTILFNEVRTKEYGEHKLFNVFYPVVAGDIITCKYNNVSGSNKILWVDFEVLEE